MDDNANMISDDDEVIPISSLKGIIKNQISGIHRAGKIKSYSKTESNVVEEEDDDDDSHSMNSYMGTDEDEEDATDDIPMKKRVCIC